MDVVVLGLGSAGVAGAVSVAHGLGLPPEVVVQRIYRAPARLAVGLSEAAAQRIASLLRNVGLEAESMPENTVLDDPPLLDVAAEIVDPAQTDAAAAALGAFLGVGTTEALELLFTPPGLLLGGASPATIAALEARLPSGVLRLLASDPVQARYALVAPRLSLVQESLLKGALPDGNGAFNTTGLAACDLDRATADRIWQRLRGVAGVRIVDQAFLRFDLQLLAFDPASATAVAALNRLAGVPPAVVEELALLLPVSVEEDLKFAEMQERVACYQTKGLSVTARLTSFRRLAVEVLRAPAGILAALGMGTARLPARTPPMTEARARHLRRQLESAGADVVFVEVDA